MPIGVLSSYMKISIRDKGKVHLSSLYYRKRFSKTNTTIATLQDN